MRLDYGWLAALVFGSALAQATSVLVFDALVGWVAQVDTFTRPDPSIFRALTATFLAMTAFSFLLTVFFLMAVSYAILATRALPMWTGWLGVGIAILNLVAGTAIFGGIDFMEAVVAGVTASGW